MDTTVFVGLLFSGGATAIFYRGPVGFMIYVKKCSLVYPWISTELAALKSSPGIIGLPSAWKGSSSFVLVVCCSLPRGYEVGPRPIEGFAGGTRLGETWVWRYFCLRNDFLVSGV